MNQFTTASYRDTAADQRLVAEISAIAANDMPRATRIAESALAGGLEHPLLLNLVAAQREDEGRYAESLHLLNRAVALDPQDVYTWTAVGLCLVKQDKRTEAVNAFEHALTINANFPQAHHHLGAVLERLGDHEGAQTHFEQAVANGPGYADPLSGLAALAARRGEGQLARDYAAKALAFGPQQPTAIAALANVDLEEKNFERAEQTLRALKDNPDLDPFDKPMVHCLLGDALDGLGRTEEAFLEFQTGKLGFRSVYAHRFDLPGVETQLQIAERLTNHFATKKPGAWSQPAPYTPDESRPARGHAFLVGFPRSGTTLLEHVLASHPDIVNVDERATLRQIEDNYLADNAALDRLAKLSAEQGAVERQVYWDKLRGLNIVPDGKFVVDKMPLYSTKLALISKLFPEVKILFAQRDPRDVVLGCFRRPFQMNPGMYQFVTLHGAARYYDAVMTLVEAYKRTLPLDLHLIRYEAFVTDFEGETRAICAFLGIDWNQSMEDFAGQARAKQIRTPSGSQVRSGLYTSGIGQWRRYARELEPIMPILQPWIERFGYDKD